MRRREFIALLGGVAAWPVAARAQNRVRRIGALMAYTSNDPEGRARAEAFEQGWGGLGWTPNKTIRMDYFWPGGEIDRIRTFASELVAKGPDVLLGGATPAVLALQGATRSIPIVFAGVTDPVGQGIV